VEWIINSLQSGVCKDFGKKTESLICGWGFFNGHIRKKVLAEWHFVATLKLSPIIPKNDTLLVRTLPY
jgi:hypothetical protein